MSRQSAICATLLLSMRIQVSLLRHNHYHNIEIFIAFNYIKSRLHYQSIRQSEVPSHEGIFSRSFNDMSLQYM